MVVGRGARAAHARRRPTQYGYTYCTRGTVAVTNQHAARTQPAVSGIGERRVCSTCSRLLVEPRRDPASMCTQVLAAVSSAVAARHCKGWRLAGAGRVVKRARRAGKGWAAPARPESQRCEQRGVPTGPRPARLAKRGTDSRRSRGQRGLKTLRTAWNTHDAIGLICVHSPLDLNLKRSGQPLTARARSPAASAATGAWARAQQPRRS